MFKPPLLAIAALILAACTAGTPQQQRAPLTLTLHNTDGAQSLRCVMILAHFVSVDIGVIKPGESQDVDFARVVDTGSLIVKARDGREMEVENILCGADTNWDTTRGDVPLLPLRDTSEHHLETGCSATPKLSCRYDP